MFERNAEQIEALDTTWEQALRFNAVLCTAKCTIRAVMKLSSPHQPQRDRLHAGILIEHLQDEMKALQWALDEMDAAQAQFKRAG